MHRKELLRRNTFYLHWVTGASNHEKSEVKFTPLLRRLRLLLLLLLLLLLMPPPLNKIILYLFVKSFYRRLCRCRRCLFVCEKSCFIHDRPTGPLLHLVCFLLTVSHSHLGQIYFQIRQLYRYPRPTEQYLLHRTRTDLGTYWYNIYKQRKLTYFVRPITCFTCLDSAASLMFN